MKLYMMDDTKFEPIEGFSIEIRNHKCYFKVNEDKHVFGSKLYPIGKKGASFFSPWDNEDNEIKYTEVARALENGNWKPSTGMCYTNAEILWKSFTAMGIDAKYYTGWAFPTDGYPIHHAWVVVDDRVYDIAVNISGTKKQLEQIKAGRNPYSKECVREVKEIENNWKPIEDNFTWGNASMIYIGSEVNSSNIARKQYNDAIDNAGEVGNHPSYRHMKKSDRYDMSPYQKLLNEV